MKVRTNTLNFSEHLNNIFGKPPQCENVVVRRCCGGQAVTEVLPLLRMTYRPSVVQPLLAYASPVPTRQTTALSCVYGQRQPYEVCSYKIQS